MKTYTVENKKGTRLVLTDCGAAVVSLFVRDASGHLADVVLGYDRLDAYLTDPWYLGTVVGRYANRIAGGRVTISEKIYELATKEGGYHHHGGSKGFNQKKFQGAPFESEQGNGVLFTYTSPDLEEGFPGEFQLEVIYTLTDNDEWSIEYKGISSKTTIVNLTQHTYFNLTGNPATPVDQHRFKILSTQYLPVNQLQVPTGELAAVVGTPFDFSEFRTLSSAMSAMSAMPAMPGMPPTTGDAHEQLMLGNGYDHSFVLEQQHTGILKHAAVVSEPKTGRRLDVYTTEPSVHFYTGNFLDQVRGKNEIIYNKRAGFCLETQHFPDSPNHAHFPSTILEAGERFYSRTIYRFSVDA